MQKDIYEKGLRLDDEGRIRLTDETARGAYFEVEGDSGVHYVRLMKDNTFNCTCMWGSLKGAPYGSLCSHVVGAVIRLSHHSASPRDERAHREARAPTA